MTKEYGPINPKFIPCANATAAPVEEVARAILEVFPGSAGIAKLKERIEAILRQHGYGSQGFRCDICKQEGISEQNVTIICHKPECEETMYADRLPGAQEQGVGPRCPKCGALMLGMGSRVCSMSATCSGKKYHSFDMRCWNDFAQFFSPVPSGQATSSKEIWAIVGMIHKIKGISDGAERQRWYDEIAGILASPSDQAAATTPSPAAAPKWNPIATAPKNASEMRVKMRDGMIHEKAHWAEDLSGSDQPPFKGWFVPDRHSGFTGIDEPEFWQPFFSPQSATNEL